MVYPSDHKGKGFLLYRDWVVSSTLATHTPLAPLATLFEPRRPRGEMQAVPCGARSDTRLLPAFTS